MTQGYTGRPKNPYVLAGIVAAHVAALTAVMLAKTYDPRQSPRRFTVKHIPLPPQPRPIPHERKAEDKPRVRSDITVVERIVPTPLPNRVAVPVTDPPVGFDPFPVGDIDILTPPPLPRPEPIPALRLDPPRAAPVKLRPRGDPARWVTNDDYPSAALRAEEQGRTAFTLTVAVDGKPTACTVTASSGSSILDAAACRLLMRRARFAPGKDADGNAVGGAYANSFSWRIPED